MPIRMVNFLDSAKVKWTSPSCFGTTWGKVVGMIF